MTRQEQGADQSHLGQNPLDVIRGGLARPVAGDGARILTEIIGHLQRIILNGHIEEGECR